MKRSILTGCACTVLALTGCGSSSSSSTPTVNDKYTQTWTTPYEKTTCKQWNTQMSDKQQWVASADMLTGAWKSEGKQDVPPDATITSFQKNITTGCEPEPTLTILDAGVTIYKIDNSFHPQ